MDSGSLDTARVDLLAAIRKGFQLKKVEKEEKEKETRNSTAPWDVAAILERRRALELETDESGEEEDDGEFADEDWED